MTTCSRRAAAAALVVGLAAGLPGCGPTTGKVKGRLVENGQPVEVRGQAAVMFHLVGPDGKPDPARSYAMGLSPDGTFELVASGGELPPGTYLVTIEVNGPKGTTGLGKYKEKYAYPTSPLRQEVRAGPNDLTIDLAKPNG